MAVYSRGYKHTHINTIWTLYTQHILHAQKYRKLYNKHLFNHKIYNARATIYIMCRALDFMFACGKCYSNRLHRSRQPKPFLLLYEHPNFHQHTIKYIYGLYIYKSTPS